MFLLQLHDHCQTLEHAPAFEVASITPCPAGTPQNMAEHTGVAQFTNPGGNFTARAISLKFLFEWSYGVLPAQHSAGPSWVSDERWDVLAKAPGPATDEQMKAMTRTLLAQRFGLKLRKETREMTVLEVTLGKAAPKLSAPKEGEEHELRVKPITDDNQKPVSFRIEATRFTLAQLIGVFARQLDQVMVNHTGMDGEYDFTVELTPDESRPNALHPALLLDAMQRQLGLAVKSVKTGVDYWVIEGAEKATN